MSNLIYYRTHEQTHGKYLLITNEKYKGIPRNAPHTVLAVKEEVGASTTRISKLENKHLLSVTKCVNNQHSSQTRHLIFPFPLPPSLPQGLYLTKAMVLIHLSGSEIK